jgi:hypothetical protein
MAGWLGNEKTIMGSEIIVSLVCNDISELLVEACIPENFHDKSRKALLVVV